MTTTHHYPAWITSSIVQYDEHVFVWLDETGNAAGAAPFFESAQAAQAAYAAWMLASATSEGSENLVE
jgi:hypothetical protein